uniref:Endoglucanase n=1 Tax=uncultured bacterium contig00017 TaxID=1181508 RepID=A0A806JYN2_9BACT|nr:endoglucanase [uncultured bacterium contig00017]
MRKRIIPLLIAIMLLSSCSKGSEGDSAGSEATPTPAVTVTEETQPAPTPAPNDTGNEGDTGETVVAPPVAAAFGINASFSLVNTWESEGLYFSQWSCTVTNNTDAKTATWTVTREFPKGTKTTDTWNGNFSFAGETLTVSNVDYNGELAVNQATEFGFIVSSPTEIKSDDAGKVSAEATGSGSSNSGNTQGNQPGNQPGVGTATIPPKKTDRQAKDWLYTDGNKIYAANGQEVWITGVNWFGYNTGTNTFDGLWTANADTILAQIADRGFNLIRIPISTELIRDWSNGVYPQANYNQATNSHWNDKNSLEIFDYIIDTSGALGLKIMIDIHCAKTDAMGHMKNVWYEGDISEEVYIQALAWMAKRYKDDDTIIAYDLKNEPHGKPDESPRAIWNASNDKDNWKRVAEKAALAVLKENPNVLIVVEGIEIYPKDVKNNASFASKNSADYHYNWWGGNLRGVKDFPLDLGKYQNKLVYSPHDYGPTVYQQPWFYSGYNYDTLLKDVWRDNWLFIHEGNIAPLLIGEWGGFMSEPNLTWMTHMRTLISKYRLHHTFWCLNANSGDTGGLLEHDFATWDEVKYAFVKEVLWQHKGKFVGLSQEIPLGQNGISLSELK